MSAVEVPVASPARLAGAEGETAHVFGDGLVGVLANPAPGATRRDVAVILFNAGMVQRSGPHRGSVQLARALAQRGFPVLRFDQSGLGDSPVPARAAADRRHAELRAAMDLLTGETGVRRFVIGGICSAADNAFRLAAVEPRIHGLLMLDGLAYRTPGYWLRHLPPRVLNPRKLWRWWRQRGTQPDMADFRDWPARSDAVAQMADMAGRGVRMLFVYTGGAYRYFNHAGQFAACLGRGARGANVSFAYWRDCDHTFYLQRDRLRLQALVGDWLERGFGDPGRPSG